MAVVGGDVPRIIDLVRLGASFNSDDPFSAVASAPTLLMLSSCTPVLTLLNALFSTSRPHHAGDKPLVVDSAVTQLRHAGRALTGCQHQLRAAKKELAAARKSVEQAATTTNEQEQ